MAAALDISLNAAMAAALSELDQNWIWKTGAGLLFSLDNVVLLYSRRRTAARHGAGD